MVIRSNMLSLRVARFVAAVMLGLFAAHAAAASDVFPRPPELEHKIAFWRSVFGEYSQHQIILHDRKNVSVVYKVLDFTDVVDLLDDTELRMHKRRIEEQEKAALRSLMLRLADDPSERGLDDEARSIRNTLKTHGLLKPEHLREIAEDLRGQAGLREKTEAAIMRSGRYLPYMEKVFADAGLPVELTRLPLVESSFNTRAYSKSGAAGMWQFMPGTAKRYMSYDEVGDDRRDPWLSTEGAAQHLSDDYSLLQDWPLAVTAYNFGRYGLARGLDEIGGSSLVELIEDYEHPRWGFAAKNFYAEFLAALDVESNALQYFGPLRRDAPDHFDEVTTEHFVRYDTLRRLSRQDAERFLELNPSFSTAVQRGELLVPPQRRIRLPRGHGQHFRSAYARLDDSELFSRQFVYYRNHRVRSGQTLSGLAQQYGTSVRAIRQANGLSSSHFIRIGQVLKIPPNGQRPVIHKVRSGETLIGIARRYGASVRQLQALNDIDRPEYLRVGVRLQVPASGRPAYAWHTIRSGQTVETIARQYGVSVSAIASANALSDVNRIRAGQRLKVPGG
ncbi:LysM peptidoglycan-binding domain-containing protein [Oceanococcus atlanticus]|nr:LysM peptidoglycan-binding domain-containing protein [Oceanococcus atlanticus]